MVPRTLQYSHGHAPNGFGLEPVEQVGWESFPPLVESLDDESDTSYDEYASASCQCQRKIKAPASAIIANNQKPPRKTVSFKNVMIREHAITVGDHPYPETLPLSLGWSHATSPKVVDIDTWETIRQGHRRHWSDLRLDLYERKNILKRVAGLSERDIAHEQRRAYFRDRAELQQQGGHILRKSYTVASMQLQQPNCSSETPAFPIESVHPQTFVTATV